MTVERIDTTNFDGKKERLLEEIGALVEGEAIQRCPVKTGNMRSKITHVTGKDWVSIGTIGVPYAKFVEHGTKVMVKAHGLHIPEKPVTDWEALRLRGGVGQTMPFLASSVFSSKYKIDELIKKTFG